MNTVRIIKNRNTSILKYGFTYEKIQDKYKYSITDPYYLHITNEQDNTVRPMYSKKPKDDQPITKINIDKQLKEYEEFIDNMSIYDLHNYKN